MKVEGVVSIHIPPLAHTHTLTPHHAPRNSPSPMFVIMISPECAPVAKVGGLGDVIHGLSWQLALNGHHLEIILPKYDCLRYDRIEGLKNIYHGLSVPYHNQAISCEVFSGVVDGLNCFFIEP